MLEMKIGHFFGTATWEAVDLRKKPLRNYGGFRALPKITIKFTANLENSLRLPQSKRRISATARLYTIKSQNRLERA